MPDYGEDRVKRKWQNICMKFQKPGTESLISPNAIIIVAFVVAHLQTAPFFKSQFFFNKICNLISLLSAIIYPLNEANLYLFGCQGHAECR